jgi:predicted DsbA family dithiol-disulfide isomerase
MYSDYVCPFCYLGRASLEEYQSEREEPLEIDWRPFDLRSGKRRPDGSIDDTVDDGKTDEYYEQAKENVRRLQDEYDVEMNLDIATDVDSLDAQVLSYHVKRESDYDQWLALDEGLLAALWEDGRDIGDEDVLVDVATDVGLDADVVETALADDALRAELHDRFQSAQREGITGVPTFAYEGHAARGAVPPEHLQRLVEGTE